MPQALLTDTQLSDWLRWQEPQVQPTAGAGCLQVTSELPGPTQIWGCEALQIERTSVPGSALEPTSFYEKLSSLMEWRRDGQLTESEVIEAKCRLGLR